MAEDEDATLSQRVRTERSAPTLAADDRPSEKRSPLPPRTTLSRYVLLEVLGEGGMGRVWKAWDPVLSRWVALKLVKGSDPQLLARFERESRVIAQLRSLREPVRAVNHLLFECVTGKGTDGLDLAVDVLSETPFALEQVCWDFLAKDLGSWHHPSASRRRRDDVWYVLLRSLARSTVGRWAKLTFLITACLRGNEAVRDSAAQAIGDLLENDPARAFGCYLLKKLAGEDKSPAVRESARDALDDLEG